MVQGNFATDLLGKLVSVYFTRYNDTFEQHYVTGHVRVVEITAKGDIAFILEAVRFVERGVYTPSNVAGAGDLVAVTTDTSNGRLRISLSDHPAG